MNDTESESFREAELWRTYSRDTLNQLCILRVRRIRELQSVLETVEQELETLEMILEEKSK